MVAATRVALLLLLLGLFAIPSNGKIVRKVRHVRRMRSFQVSSSAAGASALTRSTSRAGPRVHCLARTSDTPGTSNHARISAYKGASANVAMRDERIRRVNAFPTGDANERTVFCTYM